MTKAELLKYRRLVAKKCKTIKTHCDNLVNGGPFDAAECVNVWELMKSDISYLQKVNDNIGELRSKDLQKKVNDTWMLLAETSINIADWILSIVKEEVEPKEGETLKIKDVMLWRDRGFQYLEDAQLFIPYYHHFLDVKIAYYQARDEKEAPIYFKKILNKFKTTKLLEDAAKKLYMPYLVELFEIALDVITSSTEDEKRSQMIQHILNFAEMSPLSLPYDENTKRADKEAYKRRFKDFVQLVNQYMADEQRKALPAENRLRESLEEELSDDEVYIAEPESEEKSELLPMEMNSESDSELSPAEITLKAKYAVLRNNQNGSVNGKRRNIILSDNETESETENEEELHTPATKKRALGLYNSTDAVNDLASMANLDVDVVMPQTPISSSSTLVQGGFFASHRNSPSPVRPSEKIYTASEVSNALVTTLQHFTPYSKSYHAKVLELVADGLKAQLSFCSLFLYRQALVLDSGNDEVLYKFAGVLEESKGINQFQMVSCVSKDKDKIFEKTLEQLPQVLEAACANKSGNEYYTLVADLLKNLSCQLKQSSLASPVDLEERFKNSLPEPQFGSAIQL
ncbi:hypothetical protein Lbir_3105 [Legionella birminghamensis]|uniref:Uncharacterized protein n=1 Tax=Legionella birminghamensis TaxID=28083 RepID=A0A378IDF5_9GAMM|nr:hypothetical protein [Legionella birminghamensis]KTC66803.1 hypothetical protein Lbir_3105 [Legionella birminghamensis]STX33043.1 Uncharacterised protein [Legionella birminghamensis]